MIAAADTPRFPPMIHHLQLTHGLPLTLAYCYSLVKLWFGHKNGSKELVNNLILLEVKRLLREVYFSYLFEVRADL